MRRPIAGEPGATMGSFCRAVLLALNEAGIKPGEQFVVSPPLANPGKNAVGPYTRESETSKNAAVRKYPNSGTQRAAVLDYIAGHGGATRDEVALGLGLPDSSVDGRVWELKKYGWVEESARTRDTRHGSPAAVLMLTVKAQQTRTGRLTPA